MSKQKLDAPSPPGRSRTLQRAVLLALVFLIFSLLFCFIWISVRERLSMAEGARPRRFERSLNGGLPAAASQTFGEQSRFFGLFAQKKYEEAIQVAKAQLSKQENPNPMLYNSMGLCYYKLERYDEAERTFNEALKILPDNDKVLANLSLVYAATDRLDMAVSTAERALEISPGQSTIKQRLDSYRRQLKQKGKTSVPK